MKMAPLVASPVLVNCVTYFGALALFIVMFYVQLPNLPYPAGSFLRTHNDDNYKLIVRYVTFGLWCFHYVRRTLEVLFVHIYKRKMPCMEILGAPIYYWVFAVWIGWALQTSTFHTVPLPVFIVGVVVFAIGEVGNCYCHIRLRMFRTRDFPVEMISLQTGHVLPHGFLFNWVSCPHYFCEILSWLGFFVVTVTLPSLALFVCTFITLVAYARRKHEMYGMEFDGKDNRPAYPKVRRSLIPFLL